MACRTDAQMRAPGGWAKQRLNPNRKSLGREVGRKGVVMFPTSHDITPRYLSQSLKTVKNLLVNNRVLIVSKPNASVVRALCRELADRRKDIMFRFTVGSLKPGFCAFWEPGAPSPATRVRALRHAFEKGFQTSVSIEPMLDDLEGTCKLVSAVAGFVTDTIWVGKMQRVPRKYNSHVAGFEERLALIKSQQTDDEIRKLVAALEGNSKVRWKDSIKKVLGTLNSK